MIIVAQSSLAESAAEKLGDMKENIVGTGEIDSLRWIGWSDYQALLAWSDYCKENKMSPGEQIEFMLKNAAISGTGTVSAAGSVPAPTPEDYSRNAKLDYKFLDENQEIARSWVRRCAHAEAFALALEKALEKLRADNLAFARSLIAK